MSIYINIFVYILDIQTFSEKVFGPIYVLWQFLESQPRLKSWLWGWLITCCMFFLGRQVVNAPVQPTCQELNDILEVEQSEYITFANHQVLASPRENNLLRKVSPGEIPDSSFSTIYIYTLSLYINICITYTIKVRCMHIHTYVQHNNCWIYSFGMCWYYKIPFSKGCFKILTPKTFIPKPPKRSPKLDTLHLTPPHMDSPHGGRNETKPIWGFPNVGTFHHTKTSFA